MTRVCAWCKAVLGQPLPADGSGVTHGICPDCRARMLREAGLTPAELRVRRLADADLAGPSVRRTIGPSGSRRGRSVPRPKSVRTK